MSYICGAFLCEDLLSTDSFEKVVVEQFKFIIHDAVCTVRQCDQHGTGDVFVLDPGKVTGDYGVFCSVYDPGGDLNKAEIFTAVFVAQRNC